MSLALVYSRDRAGPGAPLVRVEVHLSGGLPVIDVSTSESNALTENQRVVTKKSYARTAEPAALTALQAPEVQP